MNFRKILFVAAVFSLGTMPHAGAQNINLNSDADSVSFYIGYMFGKQIAESGADINVHILSSGVRNALAKTPAKLNDQQIGAIMQRYFGELQKKTNEKNLKEGQDFLEANGKKQGVTTLPDGLQYKIIREGTGAKPQKGNDVEVVYHGTLIDGTVFDSAKERGEPVTFPVDGVIPGFSEALMLMSEGSLWEVYIPAELAYGERATGGIKPNSVLIFEIDLLKVKEGAPEDVEMMEDTTK